MARTGMSWVLVVALLGAPASTKPVQARGRGVAQADFDAEGYRASRYRAPVDRAPRPAHRIALKDALRLRAQTGALFIDVLPAEGGYRDPATGIWRLSAAHETIPGALWHPETGRASPPPVLWRGLAQAVSAARQRHPGIPVIVFCRTDCWMGWNAARRLALGGTARVYWLAEGIEGWHGAGRALVPAQPVIIVP